MENNMMKIAERVYKLVKQQELITEDTEFHILYQIADELLSEMGEIEQYDNVKKGLVNMFIVGRMFTDNKTS
jgi:predicted transcriptional regulator